MFLNLQDLRTPPRYIVPHILPSDLRFEPLGPSTGAHRCTGAKWRVRLIRRRNGLSRGQGLRPGTGDPETFVTWPRAAIQ